VHPAFSVIFFTTMAGAAQGLVVVLALAELTGLSVSDAFVGRSLFVALVLLVGGLISSFFHLGQPQRAWRAVLMWRTSWMSREVIILPGFIGLVGLWWFMEITGTFATWRSGLLPVLAIVGALVLWYCTAMIYACMRFIQEWAHPLTIVNFILMGLSSGLILACALSAFSEESTLLNTAGPWALGVTVAALIARVMALRRNAGLRPVSSLQSATGIRAAHIVQKSMGMSAGAFNTREFFHGATQGMLHHIKLVTLLLGFALPAACLLWGLLGGAMSVWVLAMLLQGPGLIAERWLFFAQAKHPQNLYYQTVS
jgi:sulfite dehydrogenase (quinone) subunit SoeC